jgi:hypothetical protein
MAGRRAQPLTNDPLLDADGAQVRLHSGLCCEAAGANLSITRKRGEVDALRRVRLLDQSP